MVKCRGTGEGARLRHRERLRGRHRSAKGRAVREPSHFLGAGYAKLADMLFEQLMVEYGKWGQLTAQ